LARPARGLKPLEALEAFWEKVSVPGLLFPPALRRYASFFGNANFFVPRANEATLAAKRTTSKIPIVMLSVFDPIGEGIVESLAHPGGNVTGVIMDDSAEISAKRLQLLKDAIPQISQVAVLMNLDEAYAHTEWRALEPAAQTLRTALQAIPVRRISEFEGAFQRITNQRLDAVFILNGNPNFVHRRRIVELAAKGRLATISSFRETTEAGGLMSYGSVRPDRFRLVAIYVGKILKGAKPSDLPVERPSRYEFIINLNTARSLNLEIPRDLLLVADEVIE
jgi:putative tryptophan/tyrosine transport system substrate-binding protein